MQDIRSSLHGFLARRSVSYRELASVVGKLSFISRAIIAGRTFIRRMYDLMRATEAHKPVMLRLPDPVLHDFSWWSEALQYRNRKSFFHHKDWTPAPDFHLQTDASGAWGYSAHFQGRWTQSTWSASQQLLSIEFNELYAITVAFHTWGSEWTHRRIQFHCDNSAVVAVIKSGTSRSSDIMKLVRSLYHISARHNFLVTAEHMPGIANSIADAISRNLHHKFRQLARSAAVQPDSPILPQLS